MPEPSEGTEVNRSEVPSTIEHIETDPAEFEAAEVLESSQSKQRARQQQVAQVKEIALIIKEVHELSEDPNLEIEVDSDLEIDQYQEQLEKDLDLIEANKVTLRALAAEIEAIEERMREFTADDANQLYTQLEGLLRDLREKARLFLEIYHQDQIARVRVPRLRTAAEKKLLANEVASNREELWDRIHEKREQVIKLSRQFFGRIRHRQEIQELEAEAGRISELLTASTDSYLHTDYESERIARRAIPDLLERVQRLIIDNALNRERAAYSALEDQNPQHQEKIEIPEEVFKRLQKVILDHELNRVYAYEATAADREDVYAIAEEYAHLQIDGWTNDDELERQREEFRARVDALPHQVSQQLRDCWGSHLEQRLQRCFALGNFTEAAMRYRDAADAVDVINEGYRAAGDNYFIGPRSRAAHRSRRTDGLPFDPLENFPMDMWQQIKTQRVTREMVPEAKIQEIDELIETQVRKMLLTTRQHTDTSVRAGRWAYEIDSPELLEYAIMSAWRESGYSGEYPFLQVGYSRSQDNKIFRYVASQLPEDLQGIATRNPALGRVIEIMQQHPETYNTYEFRTPGVDGADDEYEPNPHYDELYENLAQAGLNLLERDNEDEQFFALGLFHNNRVEMSEAVYLRLDEIFSNTQNNELKDAIIDLIVSREHHQQQPEGLLFLSKHLAELSDEQRRTVGFSKDTLANKLFEDDLSPIAKKAISEILECSEEELDEIIQLYLDYFDNSHQESWSSPSFSNGSFEDVRKCLAQKEAITAVVPRLKASENKDLRRVSPSNLDDIIFAHEHPKAFTLLIDYADCLAVPHIGQTEVLYKHEADDELFKFLRQLHDDYQFTINLHGFANFVELQSRQEEVLKDLEDIKAEFPDFKYEFKHRELVAGKSSFVTTPYEVLSASLGGGAMLDFFVKKGHLAEYAPDTVEAKLLAELNEENAVYLFQNARLEHYHKLFASEAVAALERAVSKYQDPLTGLGNDKITPLFVFLARTQEVEFSDHGIEQLAGFVENFGLEFTPKLFEYYRNIMALAQQEIDQLPEEQAELGLDSVEKIRDQLKIMREALISGEIPSPEEMTAFGYDVLAAETMFHTSRWRKQGKSIAEMHRRFVEAREAGRIPETPEEYQPTEIKVERISRDYELSECDHQYQSMRTDLLAAYRLAQPEGLTDFRQEILSAIELERAELNYDAMLADALEKNAARARPLPEEKMAAIIQIQFDKKVLAFTTFKEVVTTASNLDQILEALYQAEVQLGIKREHDMTTPFMRRILFFKATRAHSGFAEPLMELTAGDAINLDAVQFIRDLGQNVIKAHVLETADSQDYFGEDTLLGRTGLKGKEAKAAKQMRQKLRRIVLMNKINETLARIEGDLIDQREKIAVIPDRGFVGELSGYYSEACFTRIDQMLENWPNVVPCKLVINPDDEQERRIIGGVLFIERPEDGALVVRAINPRDSFLNSLQAESFCEQIMEVATEYAKKRGLKKVLVAGAAGTTSNRAKINDYIVRKYRRPEGLVPLSSELNFNGYRIQNECYQTRDLEAA